MFLYSRRKRIIENMMERKTDRDRRGDEKRGLVRTEDMRNVY